MGELADKVSGVPRHTGAPSQLPALLAALPADAADDLRELLGAPEINVAELRRQVMAMYPDAPVRSESTWFYWRRNWLAGDRY